MHPTIFLEFNNNLLTKSDLRYALEDYCVFEKLSNPIYNCAKNTKLEEIAKSCKKTTFVQPKDLSKMGYSVADIAFGFFQTTYNACGKSSTCLVKNIEESREMITKTFSAYKPAPKNYNHDLSSLFPAMGL
ncbi:MAG: hypothetical protein NTY99_00145 [DPANN group archaeon]|nr:hypothetical protein [DPANN group archaeon]